MKQRIFILVISLLCFIPLAPLALSKKPQPPAMPSNTEGLLRQLANQPWLMTPDYLSMQFGHPENTGGGFDRTYYWYNQHHKPVCELHQNMEPGNQILDNTFIMHLEDSGLAADDIEKTFGQPAKHFYDFQSNPTQQYSFAPNTVLLFTSPRNSFQVSEARIIYKGPPPAPENQPAVHGQEDGRMIQAQAAISAKNWEGAVPVLQSVLKEHPDNARAHCLLGKCYRQQGSLNDAIIQYKAALALSGEDQQTRSQCVAGLEELRVIPHPEQTNSSTTITRKGQHLKAN